MKIRNIKIENIKISSKLGAEIVHSDGVVMQNVEIHPETGSPIILKHTKNVVINNRKQSDSQGKELNINF